MTVATLRELGRQNAIIETNQKASAFADVARLLMIGKGNLGNTLFEAQAKRANERVVEGIKAASQAGSTSSGTFAAPLAYSELSDAFLSSLRNVGVFDAALPFAKQIPLNAQIALVSVGATASSVGEGQSKIISRLTLAASALTIRKAVCILIASQELLRASNVASRLFSDELQRGIAAETDAQFLSVLTNGITPTTSAGSNAFGIATDLAALFGGLSLDAASKVFIVAAPNDLEHIALQIASTGQQAFPNVAYNGGTHAGATFIPSDAVSGQLIAFDASQLAMASNGIELSAADQTSIQLDSAPDSPPSASTPYVNLWQMNFVGLKATRFWGVERLRSTAVSVISNVSYTSANSPA
jgi:hypothetical protein